MKLNISKVKMAETPKYPKMDQEVRDCWVAALRSGKYKQGQNDLMFNGKYCCLGVLADLYPNLKRQRENELLSDRSTAKFCGLTLKVQGVLADMNDGNISGSVKRHTFSKIAAWIERNL